MTEECKSNETYKDGKCVPISAKGYTKKTKNPVRLWGSYALPVIYIAVVIGASALTKCQTGCETLRSILGFPGSLIFEPLDFGLDLGSGMLILVTNLLFYFVVGWLLHLLIRRKR